jgi:PAS domain S-box-containing protein
VKPGSPRSRIAAVVLLAAVLPGLVWLAARWIFGDVPYPAEPLHEGMEIAGAAIALSVAMFLLLRLRHKETSPHLLWVVMALVVMGLIDGIHGMSHFGPAWSWLRHSGTMFGGLFFALVWVPLPGVSSRRTRAFAAAAAGFALVLSAVIWLRPDWFPAPWVADDYSLAVKAANALGGLGFLAAAVFFLRRYTRQTRGEDLVFAGQTTLFGIASLMFGFSSVWAADWWVWHVARLAAYGIVLGAAYLFVSALYDENSRHGEELEALVQSRTTELAVSEERFRVVLENAPIVIANLDRDLRYTWIFNPKGGLRPEEILGREAGLTTDPGSTERIRASLRDILAKGGSHHWEATAMTPQGEILFESHAEPLRSAAGEIVGLTLVSIDITARKKAEEELKASEALSRNANVILKESRLAALNLMDDALATRRQAEQATAELRLEVAERMKAEEALRKSTAELKQLTGTLEVRVRERTEELETSNARLRAEIAERLRLVAAVEQTGVGIAIMDAEGRITYVNPAFEKTSGAAGKRLLGTSYFDLLAGEAGDGAPVEKIRALALRGETWSDRQSRKNTEGLDCELDVTFSPLRDPAGAITNYLAIERDVTREVRAQQQLRQIQKIEALGTLAGGIAHDFNNILNPIFISAELLLFEPGLDPEARRSLETVLKAAERGRDLVKQIITFSRQKEKERRPVRVTPVLQEALRFLRASLPSTVEIQEGLRSEKGTIRSDPALIHQVVMNLCNNAAYAMREQGGVLSVRLAEVDVDADMAGHNPDFRPGPYLRLTVEDTGTGMSKEVAERAFDPFFTTKKQGEGSGMGLSVVHGIVKDQGGAIAVSSEPGRGSIFDVFFPRIPAEEPSPAAKAAVPEKGHGHILLVDDEKVQVDSVKTALERLGYTVTSATLGQEALDLFMRDPGAYDLVITDQTMPLMTGLELAKKIIQIRPGLPIVLSTGFSEIVDADTARKAGISRFQMKPFSLGEMAETVRAALKKGPAA